ncbi:MAG: alanine--tRNA ligase [Puniceicoccales bacterium]|nr:alanine--tRNA ligase [Puniceicoccales bacterium]
MDSNSVRQSFLDFFKSKGHTFVKSSSLLPDAPNLLFTNAGMNQFVPYLLGERTPHARRIVNTQKCIRAGGKHNDLDDVGFDTYHHTFFEMLGNWSFGDFFKEEIIEWAWELLVHVWNFPKERLYATVYRPNDGDPAQFDSVSHAVWKKIFRGEGLDPDIHIRYSGKADNFWMMGDTGPCGPCSEIHMDLTPNGDTKGELVNSGNVRCIELWNLVFMQFNALNDGTLVALPELNVDTGMGFERVVGIMATTKNFTEFSKLPSNYDSDLFGDIFAAIESLGEHRYSGSAQSSRGNMSQQERVDFSFRAIADHIRALTFAIADGIFPSNEGRGYVLRRILRRAVAFCNDLGLGLGSFADLSRVVIEKMGNVFGELNENAETVHRVIRNEEISFGKTLSRGMGILNGIIAKAKDNVVNGEDAFLLYDTYGFPIDLTQLVASKHNCRVDMGLFTDEMEKQRQRARLSQKKEQISMTGGANRTIFIGYDMDSIQNIECTVLDALTDHGNGIILDRTPFYVECGGQIGDTGILQGENWTLDVTSVVKSKGGEILHQIGGEIPQNFLGTKVRASVDTHARLASARNHTATHILHWALRSVLGPHVKQAGSRIDPKRLRFDFNHFEAISRDTLDAVEKLVQDKILECENVSIFETKFDERPEGCIANFEEKYGDIVRVVEIGEFSTELCGGCHVRNTSEICFFRIIGESSISSGVHRIEALTGGEAFKLANLQYAQIADFAKIFSCPPCDLASRINAFIGKNSALESEVKSVRATMVSNTVAALGIRAKPIVDGIYEIRESVDGFSPEEVRSIVFSLAKKFSEHVIVLAGKRDGKVAVVATCSGKAVLSGYDAGNIVTAICEKHGGKGGGKKNFAMGGF